MSEKYTYSISDDFPNDAVAPTKLSAEIDASSISSAGLSYINVRLDWDECDIWFDGVLSEADQTALDAVVAAHDGNPYPLPTEGYSESIGESQTSDTTWKDKVVLTTSSLPPGTYMVEWRTELRSSQNNSNAEIQVVVDGEADPLCEGSHGQRSWMPCSGFAKVSFTDVAVQTIRLQYRKATEANSTMGAYIRRTSLWIH